VEEQYPATKGLAFEGQSAIGGAAPVRDPQAAQPLTHMAAGVRHEWLPPRCPPEAGGLSRQDWKTVGTASAELPRADVHPASPQPPQSTLLGHSAFAPERLFLLPIFSHWPAPAELSQDCGKRPLPPHPIASMWVVPRIYRSAFRDGLASDVAQTGRLDRTISKIRKWNRSRDGISECR
jgi:hypothetical protein